MRDLLVICFSHLSKTQVEYLISLSPNAAGFRGRSKPNGIVESEHLRHGWYNGWHGYVVAPRHGQRHARHNRRGILKVR